MHIDDTLSECDRQTDRHKGRLAIAMFCKERICVVNSLKLQAGVTSGSRQDRNGTVHTVTTTTTTAITVLETAMVFGWYQHDLMSTD